MGKRSGAAWLSASGLLALAVFLLSITGCGGAAGTPGGPEAAPDTWPVHGYQGAARSGAFAVVAVDGSERTIDPLTAELRLDVRSEDSGTLVRVIGRQVERREAIYLHLSYDNAALHPALTRPGRWMPADALFLGITSQPGLVTIGLSNPAGGLTSGEEVELAALRFEDGGWERARGVSAVVKAPVTDLRFDLTNKSQLVWSFTSPGDYDQNGEVNVADITPIGVHLRKSTQSETWAAAQVADGDGNGEVNAADLVGIANNYRNAVNGFQVKGAASQAGPYFDDALVPFTTNAFPVPPGGGFRRISHTLGTPVDGSWYTVTAVSGTEQAATASNTVQYTAGGGGGLDAPLNLSAAEAGLAVRLTWQAPATGTPDSYNCYYSIGAGMTGATVMNLPGAVTNLSFDCPLAIQPTGSYYFAVKAVYGGTESAYSNIFGYNTGSGLTVPTGLVATDQGGQIRLVWVAAAGADAYNCYVGTDAAMTAGQLMNVPPTPALTFDCPAVAVPANEEHYFAVKAVHGGVESGYSNVFHYTVGGGGDTTPPVWQGGEGIKSASPAATGSSVFVTWNIATDAVSPPVKYLFYVVPDGTEFDWDAPAEVFASTITDYSVTALGDGTPLQNGQRYKFAVKAQDSAAPTENRTANVNFLSAIPQILPDSPTHIPNELAPIITSDNASVRVAGEEVPRMAGVNRGNNLYYVKWDLTLSPPQWNVTDLNQVNANTPSGRKYHPQLVAIGDNIHLLFTTNTAVYEFFGPKDSPASWTIKEIGTGYTSSPGVTGSALVYSTAGDYLACVYSARSGGNEQLWYSDRDLNGEWIAPVSIMTATGTNSTEIWQCDMTIDETTGAQWTAAARGTAGSSGDFLKFWYVRRDNRTAAWDTPVNSNKGSDVMTIDMDTTTNTPVVVSAQVRDVDTGGFGAQPVSDAVVLNWTGNAWAENVLESGDCIIDLGSFTIRTILTGQDPQLIFSPSGKAIGLWSNLDFFVNIIDDEAQLTGDWRYSQRPTTTWSSPASLLQHISSSNSVTAGESFQHCVTSDLGQIDVGGSSEIADKYSQRNNYVAGEMYFLYKPWS